jgi:subtilase family serine protease
MVRSTNRSRANSRTCRLVAGHASGLTLLGALVACDAGPAPNPGSVALPAAGSAAARSAPKDVVRRAPNLVATGQARFVRALDRTLPIRLTFMVTPPREDELRSFVADVTNSKSPRFRQYLTYENWKSQYAPADADVEAVATWAARAGFREVERYDDHLGVVVDGDVATVERSFSIGMNEYESAGRHFYANDRELAIPQEVSGVLRDVLGLSSSEQLHSSNSAAIQWVDEPVPRYVGGEYLTRLEPLRMDGAGAAPVKGHAFPAGASPLQSYLTKDPSGNPLIEPPDFYSSQAYDYDALHRLSHCCNPTGNSGGSPKETSVAVLGIGRVSGSDISAFAKRYGLATNVNYTAFNNPGCCSFELTSDVEWVLATANSFGSYLDTAAIHVYEGGAQNFPALVNDWNHAFSDNVARVAVTSFGQAENMLQFFDYFSLEPTILSMAATGWTQINGTGDDGADADGATTGVSFPSSYPFVTAVGGTTLNLVAGPTFQSETTWGPGNEGQGGGTGGTGGGCSTQFGAPFWQLADGSRSVLCLNANSVPTPPPSRTVPDIALNAGSNAIVIFNGAPAGFGGTSLGGPMMAGFFAQENSYLSYIAYTGAVCGPLGVTPCTPYGEANPALYAANPPHNPYYDVLTGCNGPLGEDYCATPGYDLVTGFGSANMLQLAWALNNYLNGGSSPPTLTFSSTVPPSDSTLYFSDQSISFFIREENGFNHGIAGYTAQWDFDPGDPTTHATPGSGDPFYDGPAEPFSTVATFYLSSAPPGCHSLFVRAWDNDGVNVAGSFGPICFQGCNDPATPFATSVACGNVCCGSGQLCAGGACCPSEQSCGSTCCPSGDVCINGACGSCGAGTVACQAASSAPVFCCPTGAASCSTTGCCPPGFLGSGTGCMEPPR